MASTRGLLLIADTGGHTTYMRTHRMALAHAEVNTARLLGNGAGSPALPAPVPHQEPDMEGFGAVQTYDVDGDRLEHAPEPLPTPTWRGRLGRTMYAAGAGLPYMLGRKGRRPVAVAG